jgi:hypothetical protein
MNLCNNSYINRSDSEKGAARLPLGQELNYYNLHKIDLETCLVIQTG